MNNLCQIIVLGGGLAIIVALTLIIIFLFWEPRTLSNDLASCGWVLCLMEGCHYCTKQQTILGDWNYPRRLVCTPKSAGLFARKTSTVDPPFNCGDIPAFPYWYNIYGKGPRLGLQSKRELKKMVG